MAITLKCERPGCTKEVQGDDRNQAIMLLQLHNVQAQSIAIKPEKPWRLVLAMSGVALEYQDWEKFVLRYYHYKTLAGHLWVHGLAQSFLENLG